MLLLFAAPRSQWILANGGEAPRIIVVDLSRSDEKTPWAAIESIKNGEISSGEHHSTCESSPCRLSSLPHNRLPSTEPTMTWPSWGTERER